MISAFGVIHEYDGSDVSKSWNFDKSKDKKTKGSKKDAPPWLKAKVKDESDGDKDPVGKGLHALPNSGMAFKAGRATRTAQNAVQGAGRSAGNFAAKRPMTTAVAGGAAVTAAGGAYAAGRKRS